MKENSNEEDANAIKLFLRTAQPAVYGSTTDSIKNGYVDGNNGPLALHNHGSFRLKKMDLNGNNQVIFKFYVQKPGATLTVRLDSPDGPVIGKTNIAYSE